MLPIKQISHQIPGEITGEILERVEPIKFSFLFLFYLDQYFESRRREGKIRCKPLQLTCACAQPIDNARENLMISSSK